MTIHVFDESNQDALTGKIVAEMRTGSVWGVNADSAYAIATDAFSFKGLRKVQQLKGRSSTITPVLIARPETLEALVAKLIPGIKLLTEAFWPGALTIVAKPNPSLAWAASADAISLRMPANEQTRDLVWGLGPMVAIAASRGQHPAPTTALQAEEIWGSDVPDWVDSGPADPEQVSTVVDFRGFMPNIVRLGCIPAKDLRAVLPSVTMIST